MSQADEFSRLVDKMVQARLAPFLENPLSVNQLMLGTDTRRIMDLDPVVARKILADFARSVGMVEGT